MLLVAGRTSFVTGANGLWRRLVVAAGVATLAAAFVLITDRQMGGVPPDFKFTWLAARSLLDGQNPYDLIGPGKLYGGGFPYIYPITGAVVTLPLGLIPLHWATALFVAAGAAVLAFAVTKDGWARLPLFLSMPYIIAARQGQWSPLLSAAFCLPVLAGIFSAKPTIGLALVAARGTTRSLVAAVVGGAGASCFHLRPRRSGRR